MANIGQTPTSYHHHHHRHRQQLEGHCKRNNCLRLSSSFHLKKMAHDFNLVSKTFFPKHNLHHNQWPNNNHHHNHNGQIKSTNSLSNYIIIIGLITTILCQTVTATIVVRSHRVHRSVGQQQSSFQSSSNDGAKSSDPSMGSTTVTDIRKLLEDYVQYLASLPDIRQQQPETTTISSVHQDVISTAETNEQLSHPSTHITYRTFVPIIHPQSQHQPIAAVFETPSHAHIHEPSDHGPGFQLELPVNSGISLSLNDEELNSFIENVLGTIKSDEEAPALAPPTTPVPTSPTIDGNQTTIENNNKKDNKSSNETLNALDDNLTDSDDNQFESFNPIPLNVSMNDDDGVKTEPPLSATTTEDSNLVFKDRSEIFEGSTLPSSSSSSDEDIWTTTQTTTTENDASNGINNNEQNQKSKIHLDDKEFNMTSSTQMNEQLTTTTPPIVPKEQIDRINSLERNNNHSILINNNHGPSSFNNNINEQQNNTSKLMPNENDSERFQREIHEMSDSDYLLEQLKRTKELLNIQIEKLKALERTVFKSNKKNAYEPILQGSPIVTTTRPSIANNNYYQLEDSISIRQNDSHFSPITQATTTTASTSEYVPTDEYTTPMPYSDGDDDDDEEQDLVNNIFRTTIQPTDNNDSYYYTNLNIVKQPEKIVTDDKEKIYYTQTPKWILTENENDSNASSSSSSEEVENDNSEEDSSEENKTKDSNSSTAAATSFEQDEAVYATTSGRLLNHSNDANYDKLLVLPRLNSPSNTLASIHYGKPMEDKHQNEQNFNVNINSNDRLGLNLSSGGTLLPQPNSVIILSNSNSNYASDNDSYSLIPEDHVNKNDSNNVETMILTHVPKITIIHKIMKPFRMLKNEDDNSSEDSSEDGGQSVASESDSGPGTITRFSEQNYPDETLYKEALRKHQDLIRSTMSSMSLYPAAFKRYKINRNNKVNSVGEIYLLPNFFANTPNQVNTQESNNNNNHHHPTVNNVDVDDDGDNRITNRINNNKNQTMPSSIIQVNNDYNKHSNHMMHNNETFINENNKMSNETSQHNQDDSHLTGHDEQNKLTTTTTTTTTTTEPTPTLTTNSATYGLRTRNIFKANQQINKPNVFELQLTRPMLSNDASKAKRKKIRAKLLLNAHTILAFNRNPENIIKLYRPRFKHRKRFRKVRLPAGYRLKKDSNSTNSFIVVPNLTTSGRSVDGENEDDSNAILFDKLTTTVEMQPSTSAVDVDEYTMTTEMPTTTTTETPSSPPLTTTVLPNSPTGNPTTIKSEQTTTESSQMNMNKMMETTQKPLTNNQIVNVTVDDLRNIRNDSNFKIFCTYDAHRSMPSTLTDGIDDGRFFDINQLEHNSVILKQCTHLVYAFANVDLNGELYIGLSSIHNDNTLRARNKQFHEANLAKLKNIKKHYPHLRVLVAVGGWDTPPQLFSLMVATGKLRDRLCLNIHKFILEHEFDGALIAWFYPVYGMKSSLDSRSTRAIGHSLYQLDDKQNLIKFVRSLRNKFESIGGVKEKLELGVMVPPFQEFIDRGYDAKKLAQSVDHLILMTYDYYGSWENQVHHFAPLYAQQNHSLDERNSKYNINYTVNYWVNEKGAPRNLTSIGVAFYGRSFTLANQSDARAGSPSTGPGIAGPITNRPGLLSFNELCELYLGNPNVRLNEDEYRITANLQLFDQWVGFDDELSLYLKTKYAIGNQLSGIFIWSINYDDYRNRCGWGRFPLLNAVNKAVEHCTLWRQQCNSTMVWRQNITEPKSLTSVRRR